MREIDIVIVHESYTRPSQNIGAETIRDWHVNGRGWDDIGYHFVIRRDGVIDEGRPLDVMGAHAYGHNQNSIGICLVGGRKEESDKPEFNFTFEQMFALHNLYSRYNDKQWIGHNQVSNKICPGFNVQALLENRD